MVRSPNDQIIRAIIVDDERLAIKSIKIQLQDYPHIRVVGSADTINKAKQLIANKKPDLIFLDIQLQGETGFDLIEKTNVNSKVIFITAFDEYAVRAFEVNALDYLLKPVSRKRFKMTMDRVLLSSDQRYDSGKNLAYNDVILLNNGTTIRFVKLSKIQYINAEGDYSRVMIRNEQDELILRTLKVWESMLPAKFFLRIHRSTIVNVTYIQRVEKTTSNRFLLHLDHEGPPITISQRYSAQLKKEIPRLF